MMIHPLIEQLRSLRLSGMAKILSEQLEQRGIEGLSFEERLGLLVQCEIDMRENRRLQLRLKRAKFKEPAAVEDIEFTAKRQLDRMLITKLSQCQWIRKHHNLLITGATGTGKTYLACALAHKGCLEGFSSRYFRLPRLLAELQTTRVDGRYLKLLKELEKTDVLIIDDWGIDTLSHEQRRDILEVFDDRHGCRSTIITSQLPVKLWHERVGDKIIADAIMDRLIHQAYRIECEGESMRKVKSTLEEELSKSGG